MNEVPFTRAFLESLTTSDLLELADSNGVDVSNKSDRVFLIEELLELSPSEDDRPPVTPEAEISETGLVESVPLPKQYNITFIEVMIRDPLWAFVFWEIKASDKEQYEKAGDFSGYYLKVSNLDDSIKQSDDEGLFIVPVKPDDTARYLNLSPAFEKDSRVIQNQFKIEFCAGLGGTEAVLAVSSPVRSPKLPEFPSVSVYGSPGNSENDTHDPVPEGNKLIRLSGYENFHVLRKNERQPRWKKAEGVKGEGCASNGKS